MGREGIEDYEPLCAILKFFQLGSLLTPQETFFGLVKPELKAIQPPITFIIGDEV